MKQRRTRFSDRIKSYRFYTLALITTITACSGPKRASPSRFAPPSETVPQGAPSEEAHAGDAATLQTATEWLAIFIDGHKTGYVKSTRTLGNDTVTTETTTHMELQRGETTNQLVTVTTVTETADGRPLGFEKRVDGSGMRQHITGTVRPDGRMRITTEVGGAVSSRESEWPKDALTTEAQRREALRYGLTPGVTYTSRYFDPDLLEAIDVKVTVGEKQPLDLLGRFVEGTKVRLEMVVRGTPLEMVMYVDDEMNTLKTVSNRMGMTVEMIACTPEYATSDNDPKEMIAAAIIHAPRALSDARRRRPLTYTISGLDEAARSAVVETSEQTVKTKGDRLTLTVSKHPLPKGVKRPYRGDDPAARRALEATEWIQNDAPEIVRLAEIAVGGAVDARAAALNIEKFVTEYIAEKSFSVGYASALEVARSRQGDCTEHALFTAALCRAAGIPADVVFGLVYVAEYGEDAHLFGGHAWSRVFLDGSWYSLDASLGGFDTGHIALTVSDGDPGDFFKIIDVVGNLTIDAIE